MIIGSLSTLAVNRQDIGGAISPVSGGQTAPTVPATVAGATSDAASAASGVSYVSPFGRYDYSSHLEILQFRNAETGKVVLQIPSERVVDAYRRGAAISGQPQASHASGTTQPAAAATRSANQDSDAQTAAAAFTGQTPPAFATRAAGTGAVGTGAAETGGTGTNGSGSGAPPAAPPEPVVTVITVATPTAAPVAAPTGESKPAQTAA